MESKREGQRARGLPDSVILSYGDRVPLYVAAQYLRTNKLTLKAMMGQSDAIGIRADVPGRKRSQYSIPARRLIAYATGAPYTETGEGEAMV